MTETKMGFVVLESGETFPGTWLGGEARAGEVVFNTSHSGYEEIATDPSYLSQIMVMSAPMQGNYGVDPEVWESKRIWIEGFVCLQMQESSRDSSWRDLLAKHKVPTLTEVDTRELILCLRSKGTPWGALVPAATAAEAKTIAAGLITKAKAKDKDWVYLASRKETEVRKSESLLVGPRVAVLDFGVKENILRLLSHHCSEVHVFNSRATPAEILKCKPDFLMLTNGPGDPADVKVAPETVRALVGLLPIFGICMGHQILALALGAKTYKLQFGHRGSNNPIKDSFLGKVYMSAQNHGYAVDEKTLPMGVEITQVNLNDFTVAGIAWPAKKILSVQYHPESCPGPHDASLLFDGFIKRFVYGND